MTPNIETNRDRRNGISSMLLRTVAAVALTGIAVHPAIAQQSAGPSWQPMMDQPRQPAIGQPGQLAMGEPAPPPTVLPNMRVLATPYFWIPWTDAGVRPGNTQIPSASTNIDPGQLISHLTWVPFMGEVEFRSGPYGVLVDYIHAPLKAGVSTRNVLFNGGTGGVTINSGTAMFLYRVFAQPDQYVDIGAGIRAWGLDGDISLNQGLLVPVSVSKGEAWADPMIAARYHRDLGNGFGATVYGDLGGFGVGAHVDWQVLGTIDYAASPGIDLHAGFRSLNSIMAPSAQVSV